MTVLVPPEIQQQYDQNAAAHRAAAEQIAGTLRTRQQELTERVAANREELAALGRQLARTREQPTPTPARRSEDNDISAKAADYQEEPDEDVPAPDPPPPAAVTRRADDEEDVPSFRWDEDRPAGRQPHREQRPAQVPDADEDLSERDWLA